MVEKIARLFFSALSSGSARISAFALRAFNRSALLPRPRRGFLVTNAVLKRATRVPFLSAAAALVGRLSLMIAQQT